MEKQTVQVKHLRYTLRGALERLMAKDPKRRPFVVVSEESTASFLQFAGSAGQPLIIDIPQMLIQDEMENVASAVLYADDVIWNHWKLSVDTVVTITEDEDKSLRGDLTRKAREWREKLLEKIRALGQLASPAAT